MLEENTTLQEIYCENNDINLQAMTVLVDSLRRNRSVLYLPRMDPDRSVSLQNLDKEIQSIRSGPTTNTKSHSVRRTLATVKGAKVASVASQPTYTDQDIRDTIRLLDEKWDKQASRLEEYLMRNFNIARGIPVDDDEGEEDRPTTGHSMGAMLEKAALSTTPTLESGDHLAEIMSEKIGLDTMPHPLPPRRSRNELPRKELQV